MEQGSKRAAWEQHDAEGASAFRAFCIYRSMPPSKRSVDRAYAQHTGKPEGWCGRSAGHFSRWSSEHQWVERAEAYDVHIMEAAAAADFVESVNQLREYRSRNLVWAERADAIAHDLLERIEASIANLDVKNANDAARVARAARDLMDSANGARAQALSVEELLNALDDRQK